MNLEQKIALMQNPIELEYLAVTGKTTYYGEETRIAYKVGGIINKVFVDERDVDDFLSYSRKNKKIFKIAEPVEEPPIQTKVVEEKDVATDEEINDFVGEFYEDLTIFKGVGNSSEKKLHDAGVTNYSDLLECSYEQLNEIISISESNYKAMKQKLEEILTEE